MAFFTGPGTRKARNVARDPRVALSVTARDDPFTMAAIRGRVVGRLAGERAWEVIDRIAEVRTGRPYPRGEERVVYLVDAEHVTATAY